MKATLTGRVPRLFTPQAHVSSYFYYYYYFFTLLQVQDFEI